LNTLLHSLAAIPAVDHIVIVTASVIAVLASIWVANEVVAKLIALYTK
jgi:hypothetical protein